MLHIALYEPEIPPNTGNLMRLAANTGARLHLIEPLGFSMEESRLRRAGLDYRQLARVERHRDYGAFLEAMGERRVFALSTRGRRRYCDPDFADEDVFLLGPETRGLPESVLGELPPQRRLRIPMQPNSRSLNLANAATLILYEAWRQLDFPGGA